MKRAKVVSLRTTTLAVITLLAPAAAAGQQVVHISRSRSAVALSITGRTLPAASILVNAAPVGCPLEADAVREATGRVGAALAAAVPPGLPPGLVLITVTPQPYNAQCRASPDDVANLTAAAIEFRPPVPDVAITSVEVAVAEQVLTPTLLRTIKTAPLWSRDDSASAPAVQVALPLEHFVPDRRTGTRPVVLLISRESETIPERVELSETDIDALWRLALTTRAAAAGADPGWAERVTHAAPLAVAELPEAAALMQQLSAAGDSLASRSLARQALATEPCLRLPGEAPVVATTLLEESRPAAHCRARRPITAALSGTLVPGLGQVSSRWRTIAGIVVLGVVAQRLHASQVSKRDGRAYYQQYLDATSIPEADEYWARADKARRQTDVLIMQASALWLGAAAEATWFEWRLGKRLRFAAPVSRPVPSR